MNFRVKTSVVLDDGSDGIFWKDGMQYSREHGRETPMSGIAPHLTEKMMIEIEYFPYLRRFEKEAMLLSMKPMARRL